MKSSSSTQDHVGKIGGDWKSHVYYDIAEVRKHLLIFWSSHSPFRRMFNQLNTNQLVELACGHGRHTQYYLDEIKMNSEDSITLVDINIENIEFCKKRFADKPHIYFVQNNGRDLSSLANDSATALFCYDAMVHFEVSSIITYLEDIGRVLKPGGRALLHHSNLSSRPGAIYSKNPHARNFMTKNLFAHLSIRAGLNVLEQHVINWGFLFRDRVRNIDCLTLVERPK